MSFVSFNQTTLNRLPLDNKRANLRGAFCDLLDVLASTSNDESMQPFWCFDLDSNNAACFFVDLCQC